MEERKLSGLIDCSLHNLSQTADANLVLGTPVTTASGSQIIPFSRVTLGNLSGGGEYGDVKLVKESGTQSFAGGSGSIVSLKPLGFIIDDGKECRIVKLTDEPLENLVEKLGDVLRNLTSKKEHRGEDR